MYDVLISMNGNMFCATFTDFINLQESPAGFGETSIDAAVNLFHEVSTPEDQGAVKKCVFWPDVTPLPMRGSYEIELFGENQDLGTLNIRFPEKTSHYLEVPPQIFEGLYFPTDIRSFGGYFNRHVRGQYRYHTTDDDIVRNDSAAMEEVNLMNWWKVTGKTDTGYTWLVNVEAEDFKQASTEFIKAYWQANGSQFPGKVTSIVSIDPPAKIVVHNQNTRLLFDGKGFFLEDVNVPVASTMLPISQKDAESFAEKCGCALVVLQATA